MAELTVVDPREIAFDRWDDPARGSVEWKTLISADRTPSDDLVCGLAVFPPHGALELHHHEQAEIVHVLAGDGTGCVGDETVELSACQTVFVPGGVAHRWEAGAQGLTLLYVIAASSFQDIEYVFD
jgi:quercetin dioxygenase-like cupin family protein